jgi:hypothetical protein
MGKKQEGPKRRKGFEEPVAVYEEIIDGQKVLVRRFKSVTPDETPRNPIWTGRQESLSL